MARRQDGKEVVFSCSDGPFRAVSAVVLGGNILDLDFRLRRAKESGKVSRGLIIHLDMSDGTRVRRKEGTGRAKSMNIGGRGARLEGNKMNIIAMKEKKNVFITVMRGDRETTSEVSRSPFTATNGARASGVCRKGKSRGSKARTRTRRKRVSGDKT